MRPIVSNDRIQTLRPHPEEAALFARPSRRMAAGTISPVAVLRDARIEIGCLPISILLDCRSRASPTSVRAPQDEADGWDLSGRVRRQPLVDELLHAVPLRLAGHEIAIRIDT